MNWSQWLLIGCSTVNALSIGVNLWVHRKGKQRETRMKAMHLPSDIVLSIDAQSYQVSLLADEIKGLTAFMKQAWGNPEDKS